MYFKKMITPKIKNICCIGAGYVGGPTMSVIAEKCPDININVVDVDEEKIRLWNSKNLKKLPVFEPGLEDIIKNCRGRNLIFSTNLKEHISTADMVFISVNTPTKKRGIGAGQASDLKYVEACARQVAEYSKGFTIVVEKSTLPVRTAEAIIKILESQSSQKNETKNFAVLSNPEFLAEGTAIKDLNFPDRVLIGGENEDAIQALSEIYKRWVPEKKILHTNIWSSELAKLTANAFLAQRISSINSIGALCEATGADVREVARAIGTDTRIGSKFLDSGPGFGGSCFKKDILNLVYLSKYYGLNEVANFWEGVVHLNSWNQQRISEIVVKKLFGTVTNKKICILGFAFKANTNDTRESAAIKICRDLLKEGGNLFIHDPKVNEKQITKDLSCEPYINKVGNQSDNVLKESTWQKITSLEEGFIDADAVLILTEWEEYSKINWESFSNLMRRPAWIFDSRSIIDMKSIKNTDLNFWRVGDGSNLKS